MNHFHQMVHHLQDGIIRTKLKIAGIYESVMVERNHEGDDKDSLFKHKHRKIQQTPSYTSKAMAINNFKILIVAILTLGS
jgi:hypothetical protein